MVFNLFNTPLNLNYTINDYFVKKIDNNKYFISTNHGSWVILDSDEFYLLKTNELTKNRELLNQLHEKQIILSEYNLEETAKIYKNKCSHITNGAKLHIMIPTLRCTNKCTYCHAKSKDENATGYDIDEDTAKQTVDFLFNTPSKELTIEFQGGEPLLNFDIVRYVVDYANSVSKKTNKKVRFALVSNFTKMDEDILNFSISNKIGINTSLDGPKEVHDKNRKYLGNGTYENVIYWLDYIIKEKKYRSIGALPTPTRYALDYPEEIVDEYVARGLKTVFARYLNCSGFAKRDWNKLGYTANEFITFWSKMLDYTLELNKKKIQIQERWAKTILSTLINPSQTGFTCLGSPCGAILTQIAYETNGDVYSCDESRSIELFKIGNVKNQTYSEIINSSQAQTIASISSGLINTCDSCVWHPYCGTCPVSLYNSTGNLNTNPKLDSNCLMKKKSFEYIVKKIAKNDKNTNILINWLELSDS
ncbi:MAG: His-Xaa-Ser system radical SAM maturase HxsB [Candidatus Diapherotrites archaeon]|nr:His-Xaa-Ser system radical SAM maturase HxsB [Candidatus Diapherotrites archaeon]